MKPASSIGREMRQDRPHAIVIGLDCLQGLQSARILAARGVPVIGIAKDRSHYATSTRVCERLLFVDTGGDALIDLLEQLGSSFRDPPVLFPCQDKNVLVLSRARERLQTWYRIALAEPGLVEKLTDKSTFFEYAASAGLPVPPTRVLENRDDAERAATELSYPTILKPSVRLREWSKHTKVKALIAEDPAQLLDHYDVFSQWASVLVAQQLIRGGDGNHVTCNSYFDRRGEPVVTFTTRKIRQWPPKTGQACASVEIRDDEAVELTRRVFGGIGYHGLAYLESKRDEVTGEHLIIEANVGRPTGRASTAEAAGVELLYTMYCDAVGLPLPAGREQRYLGVTWLHIMRDLQASGYHWTRGELSLHDWARSLRGPRTHAIASRRDPMPFLKALRGIVPALRSPRNRATPGPSSRGATRGRPTMSAMWQPSSARGHQRRKGAA
jgi:D-aspartate ligase